MLSRARRPTGQVRQTSPSDQDDGQSAEHAQHLGRSPARPSGFWSGAGRAVLGLAVLGLAVGGAAMQNGTLGISLAHECVTLPHNHDAVDSLAARSDFVGPAAEREAENRKLYHRTARRAARQARGRRGWQNAPSVYRKEMHLLLQPQVRDASALCASALVC
jgi:hypothetical protein